MNEESNPTLGEIGEKKFLSQLVDIIDTSVLPFNDDASSYKLPSGDILVINADMLVQKTDVVPGMKPQQIGKKAVTMSVSDLIAKNAKPLGCLASVGFPSDIKVSHARNILEGIKSKCTEYGILYLGGDLNETDDVVLDLVSFGICAEDEIIPRKGAKNGDLLFSTGLFGLTSLGYKKLLQNKQNPSEINKTILLSVHEPRAKIEYLDLFRKIPINSCMDSSDGLLVTLKELSEINNLGIDVTDIPIHSIAKAYISDENLNPLDLVFNGGEEFELIFSILPEKENELLEFTKENDLFLKKIGSYNKDHRDIKILDSEYSEYTLPNLGFEHFRKRDIH